MHQARSNESASFAQALNLFVDHLHLSAEALEALLEHMPEDNRRRQDTIMEFGLVPPVTGSGGNDAAMYLEGSQIFMEGTDTPILTEGG